MIKSKHLIFIRTIKPSILTKKIKSLYKMKNENKFATKCIHAGIEPDASSGAIMTPIFQTSTYVQNAPGDHKGFEYARTHNPTRRTLETQLAALESGADAVCFSSGLAAMDAVLKLLKSGDEVIATNDLYGGSYRLITKIFDKFGIKSKFVSFNEIKTLEDNITSNTKLIWVETPTNPMLNIVDIKAVCELAKKHNIMTCVDNTFASPYLQRPIELGADLVLHSATKYLGGHSDVVHGCVITATQELSDQLHFVQNAAGAVPGPQDCFLVLRGLKTLHLRVQRACENAEKIAKYLKSNPMIDKVYWPGFEDNPYHEIAKKQMSGFGGMVSFDVKGGSLEDAHAILNNTKLFALAESLGGVESLIGHPSSMTHASIPREERLKVGLTDSLIRLSVGIEDADDLIKDLETAIKAVKKA